MASALCCWLASTTWPVCASSPAKLVRIARRVLPRFQPAAAPSTWSAGGYQKKGQKSGGVIALMEMLIKDVGTQMHEGKLDEENSQKNHT